MIGYKPDLKSLGKRSALNAHAAFDVAGAGNTIGWVGAPVLDPTRERFGGETPPYLLDRGPKSSGQITYNMTVLLP
jgi:hypothetical protein